MKTTYTRTLMIREDEMPLATFRLEIYDKVKYETLEVSKTVTYTGVKAWTIVCGGDEAKAIESLTDESGIDENHDYLILHFTDGSTSTFRNSHVDLFIR